MRVENSFIGVDGVGEQTEQSIWEQGVTHWDEFEPSVVGGKRGDRIDQFIREGREYLDAADVAYFDRQFPSSEQWRLYETFDEQACFFDIETTGLDEHRNQVTTVSLHQAGETETLVAGDDLTAGNLRAAFADADLLVTFNGKRFDVPFLEANFDVDLQRPHLDLMYTCKKIGLSGGLKQVEQDIGIERDRPDISGQDAVRLWREHERGQDGSLETLVSYNREDTVNLQTLADEVTTRLDERIFVG
ncbi:ribonuclease H-like domain-containing protein [Haloarcula salinisoli]|uniref:Ribonuclease H-like domain-containing protein n=1 Tax=Haloarcula salinisoli TaxID=2487746 RepID=A0A8J7YJN0_9EURY|nr:ribonuclease H-like domain-containing protein [Halomicroarcula salinisoli]MBX0286638.1 ribonuclease H-like domain-containing protein [Halomicroarcula salinisoli]MBX0303949.1 ribonuclease H-like domain-containing protein [Halomicroarcula salinisoli]